MKIPKYFREWFNLHGLGSDYYGMETWQYYRILRIAWRAYRKGIEKGRSS